MAVACVIFMEKTNDIVVNLDAIILFKTSSSALIMALKKKECKFDECTNRAVFDDHCRRHGGRKCTIAGCNRPLNQSGMCLSHFKKEKENLLCVPISNDLCPDAVVPRQVPGGNLVEFSALKKEEGDAVLKEEGLKDGSWALSLSAFTALDSFMDRGTMLAGEEEVGESYSEREIFAEEDWGPPIDNSGERERDDKGGGDKEGDGRRRSKQGSKITPRMAAFMGKENRGSKEKAAATTRHDGGGGGRKWGRVIRQRRQRRHQGRRVPPCRRQRRGWGRQSSPCR
jgi:hypothetical protein